MACTPLCSCVLAVGRGATLVCTPHTQDHYLTRFYHLRMAGLRLQEDDAVVQQRLHGLKTTFRPRNVRVEGMS